MVKHTREQIEEHFRPKEEVKEEKEDDSEENSKGRGEEYNSSRKDYNKEYMEDYRENFKDDYNSYMKAFMKYRRLKKKDPDMNISFEEWAKNNKEYQESREIKKSPIYFPKDEFNRDLDRILKDNPSEVLEKKLKDTIYDILDKKGILTPNRIIQLYNDDSWANAIQGFMSERNYSKNGDDTYVHTEK